LFPVYAGYLNVLIASTKLLPLHLPLLQPLRQSISDTKNLLQASEKELAKRERNADDAVRVGLQLQQENRESAAAIAERQTALTAATEDLRALKNDVAALIKGIGTGVQESASAEARAQATWVLLRDHVSSLASGAGIQAEDIMQPPFLVRSNWLRLTWRQFTGTLHSARSRLGPIPLKLWVLFSSMKSCGVRVHM
jgi:hypothetical protein